MIFDWIQNCENIYQTKHFPNSDGQEKKTMVFQHTMLFKFLEEQKGMTKEQVKDFWQQTDSPILESIPQDERIEWINVEFEKIWQMRERSKINFSTDNENVYNFPIYQEEIDYLNSLDCDTWVKKALLLLLSCAKHRKNGLVKYNNTTTAWIERCINPKYKVRDKMIKIGRVNSKYKLFTFVFYGRKGNRIKLNFIRPEGKIAAVIYSPNHMQEALDLIIDKYLICPSCGKHFIPSPKQQTILCEDCYKEKRKFNNKELDGREKHDLNKTHHAGKGSRIHQVVRTCTKCGSDFLTTKNCKRYLCDNCYVKHRRAQKTLTMQNFRKN